MFTGKALDILASHMGMSSDKVVRINILLAL